MEAGLFRAWTPIIFDLDAPARPIDTGGAARLHVTVVESDVPVGQVVVTCPVDPMPWGLFVDQIRYRLRYDLAERYVNDLGGYAGPVVRDESVAVIVCTKGRPDSLERSLASIRAASSGAIDLIVVENSSTTEEVQGICQAHGARYLSEPLPGLDRARNRGAALTTADVLLFTDDDVEVDPGWIDSLAACFEDPLVMAATGLVIPAALDTAAQRNSELFASHGRGTRRRVLDGTTASPAGAGSLGVGASMSFRRSFLVSIGGFPEELDAGMPTGTGGDTYALHRVLRSGYRVVYEPRAIARHWHRQSDEELVQAFRANGSGITSHMAHVLWSDRDPSALTQTLPAVGRYLLKRALGFESREGIRLPATLARAEGTGAVAGFRSYMKARSLVQRWGRAPIAETAKDRAADRRDQGEDDLAGELPTVSVIVPTRGRRDSVVSLLSGLQHQNYPPGWWEIVVVIDGDIDGTEEAIEAAGFAVPVQVAHTDGTEASGRGPATARNLGATLATGEVLVFLDDDVVPGHVSLLREHASRHQGTESLVAGPAAVDMESVNGFFAQRVRNWWVEHTKRMDMDVVPHFTDLCTGNFSIPAGTFKRIGGFADLARREDWEFSYRAVTDGMPLVLAPEASVIQTPELDVLESLNDRRGEGSGDAEFARLHPEMLTWLPLGMLLTPNRRISVARMLLAWPGLFRLLTPIAGLLPVLERLGMRRRWASLLDKLNFVAYWSGVGERVGGPNGWLDLVESSQRATRDHVTVDLVDGAAAPPEMGSAFVIRVVVGEEVLGELSPAIGGLPWDRSRFSKAAKARFFSEIVSLGAGQRVEQ